MIKEQQKRVEIGTVKRQDTERKSKLCSANKNFAFSIFVFLKPKFEPIPKKTILA